VGPHPDVARNLAVATAGQVRVDEVPAVAAPSRFRADRPASQAVGPGHRAKLQYAPAAMDRDFELQRGNLKSITCDAIGCDQPGHAVALMLGSPAAIIEDADEEGWAVPNREALEAMAALPPEAVRSPRTDGVVELFPPTVPVSRRLFVLCADHHPEKDVSYGGMIESVEPGYEDLAHQLRH
jgi:hypothetical protein